MPKTVTPIQFLSTLSLRRATRPSLSGIARHIYFYPRSPCGERLSAGRESDTEEKFLSTLSLRRATQVSPDTSSTQCISIHALLAESDNFRCIRQSTTSNFYPRSPCGERRQRDKLQDGRNSHFYPRSPCGERRQTAHQ